MKQARSPLQQLSPEELLRQSNQLLLEGSVNNRPSNTKSTYYPKQEEFKNWCAARNFAEVNRFTVTEDKLVGFLKDCVVGRRLKRKRKQSEAENGVDEVVKTVSVATVNSYVASIVDLYNYQVLNRANNFPSPRGPLLSLLIEQLKRDDAARRARTYDDRQVGTLNDGYCDTKEVSMIADEYMKDNNWKGLRDRASFLMMHFGILRGEPIRMMQLPDLFSIPLVNEGPNDCRSMVMLMNQGKTNQFSCREFAACIRAKDVSICGMFIVHYS